MKRHETIESAGIRRNMFLFLLMLVTISFFGLIFNLLMACFWASIFAILFQGVFVWLTGKVKGRRSLAALLTTLIILFAVVIPLGLISIAVVNESKTLYASIEQGSIDPSSILKTIEDRIPTLERVLNEWGIDLDEVYQRVETFFASVISTIGQGMWQYTQDAIGFIVQFVLMLYLLFFLVRDGDKVVMTIRNTLPMGNKIEDVLFKKFAQVARATLKGTVIVAACQGTMGGVLFAILGIQGAVLWGVLMGLLSLLPIGGSGLVWVPTAIVMFIQGHVTEGIVIVIVGLLGIGLIDNLLRPILVGRETKMPDYVVLLATLGGLTWFGLSGFILGPVIAALFITCWQITGDMFGGKE